MQTTRLTKEQALQKIRHYCAYQERCHFEVKEKLYGFGLRSTDVDELIVSLIEDNYLNEERFAIHFAGGKFRTKSWGRKKIEYELKQKKVSPYCIKKALGQFDVEEYLATLEKLAEKKKDLFADSNAFYATQKLKQYLFSKGWEMELIDTVLKKICL
jgi:regulatory protein